MGNEPAVFLRIMLLFVTAAQQLHANPSVDPVSGTDPAHTFHSLDQKPTGTTVGSAAAVQELPSTALTDALNDDANHLSITDQGALVTHTTLNREDQNLNHMMVEAVDSQTPPSTAQNLKYPSVTENLNNPELQKELYVTGSKKLNPESKPPEPLTPALTEQKYPSVTENLNNPELQKELYFTGSKKLNPESKPPEPLTHALMEQKYPSVTENLNNPELQKELYVTGSKKLNPESKPPEPLTPALTDQVKFT
ncbi:uncharacterized protein [Pleurodeles waltl]|uniref:uncharacterized protein n=1 Tax=Pleurodeles waltl TaxID=8319 RepID=UPI0037098702